MFIGFPDGTTAWITPDDIVAVVKHLLRRETRFLDYRITSAQKHYGKGNINWVQVEGREGIVCAPYELVVDYRQWPKGHSWGKISLLECEYSFPPELSEHRDAMAKMIAKTRPLVNNPCPRVSSIETHLGVPEYYIQKAWYLDQVGTNLTLDHLLDPPVSVGGVEQSTVRDWDIAQCGLEFGYLPSLKRSRLANTIGVAIGITAETDHGQTVIVARKRREHVAVYPNVWHVPCSFALSVVSYQREPSNEDLKGLISFDLGHEEAAELGLEPADLGELVPVAFCRDLVRGGKPQFFFQQRARISFEQLTERIRESSKEKEYGAGIAQVSSRGQPSGSFSPELVCFLLLVSNPS